MRKIATFSSSSFQCQGNSYWGLTCLIHRVCWSFLIRQLHLGVRNNQYFVVIDNKGSRSLLLWHNKQVHKDFVMHTYILQRWANVSSIPNYTAFRSQRKDRPYHSLILLPWCTLQHLVCATQGREKLDQVYCAWLIKWVLKREIIQLA